MRVLFLYIWLIFLNIELYSNNDCSKLLSDYLENLTQFSNPGNHIQYLDFVIKNEYKSPENKAPASMNIKLWVSEGRIVYKTDRFSYFMDKNDAFLIMKDNRQVVWMDGSDLKGNEEYMKAFTLFQKDFIGKALINCRDTLLNGQAIKFVNCNFNTPLVGDDFPVSYAIYKFNTQNNQLMSSGVYYHEHESLKSQQFIFNEVNYDYKKIKPIPVVELVFSSGTTFNKEFQGYTLVNNKNK